MLSRFKSYFKRTKVVTPKDKLLLLIQRLEVVAKSGLADLNYEVNPHGEPLVTICYNDKIYKVCVTLDKTYMDVCEGKDFYRIDDIDYELYSLYSEIRNAIDERNLNEKYNRIGNACDRAFDSLLG